jgi:hypothetical protein
VYRHATKKNTVNKGLIGEPNFGMLFGRQELVSACHSNSFIVKRGKQLAGAVAGYNLNLYDRVK